MRTAKTTSLVVRGRGSRRANPCCVNRLLTRSLPQSPGASRPSVGCVEREPSARPGMMLADLSVRFRCRVAHEPLLSTVLCPPDFYPTRLAQQCTTTALPGFPRCACPEPVRHPSRHLGEDNDASKLTGRKREGRSSPTEVFNKSEQIDSVSETSGSWG
jgi:hypothetical protein